MSHLNEPPPAFRAPPLSCDAHFHVFGPADRFPYAPKRTYTPEDAPKEYASAFGESSVTTSDGQLRVADVLAQMPLGLLIGGLASTEDRH